MFTYWYQFKQRIRIIWHWLPIIWNDYDWQENFILLALQHKIKRTRIEITKNDRHTCAIRNSKNMRIAELLIDRINNPHSFYDSTFKHPFCTCEDDVYERSYIGNNREWIAPKWCAYCKFQLRFNQVDNLQKRDLEMLTNILNKHLFKWWD